MGVTRGILVTDTHRWLGLETTKRIQNGGYNYSTRGSPATCKLKSFRGFYGFREDIREARALREIDQSVVSAAIRVSSVQNIKTS